MAAVRPPRSKLSTPFSSTLEHVSATNRPKLRDSCYVCASSKLKCSQNKPTCSRCVERGLTCEYVVAKQGGRKPNGRSSSNNRRGKNVSKTAKTANDHAHSVSQANWVAPSSSYPSTNSLRSLAVMHHTPRANVFGSSDMLQDFFDPMDQTLSSTSTNTGTDLDNLFNSPISFSTDLSNVNIFDTADLFSTSIDSISNGFQSLSDAFSVFEDAIPELPARSIPSSAPQNYTLPSKEVHNHQEVRANESSCSCLIQALGSMKQLFSSPSNPCMTWATQSFDNATAMSTIQAVIARTEATIEAVSTMLQCSCSQDAYLLSVISLIIFKVLGWYAAVARKNPSLQNPHQSCHPRQPPPFELARQNDTIVGSSYCLDGADSARMTAQLILNELHRVRQLIDQLLSKLKVQAAKKGRRGVETPESMDLDNGMAWSLSAVMYDQLDNDLRKRLRALSCEMLDRLRRV